MKLSSFVTCSALALSGLLPGMTPRADAATRDVPTQYANIFNAIAAAQSGDEIRVANNYAETEAFLELTGKNVTIRSYLPNFSAPAPGATWNSFTDGDINTSLITIINANLTIEGFRDLRGVDCNVFFLQSDAGLSIKDCVLTGTSRADTAGIKSGTNARNLSINVENTSFTSNGRGIWLNRIGGNTSLVMSKCAFVGNSSYPLNWESVDGNHTVDISDTYCDTRSIRMMRFFGFRAPAGTLTTNRLNFERCHFYALPNGGRYPLSIAGVDDTADPNSTMTVNITNCLFDLRDGEDNVETVALNSQDETATRRSEINMNHCTVVFNGTQKCGIRLREHQSTLTVANSIFYAQGQGNVIFRSLRGKTISRVNLLDDTTTVSQVFAGGSVELSGNEIYTAAPGYVSWNNKDYRLTDSSPALGAGENLGVTNDILGNPRPVPAGSLPDIGAYEYVMTAAVWDWSVY